MILFRILYLFSWRVVVISGYICSLGWLNVDKAQGIDLNLLSFKR